MNHFHCVILTEHLTHVIEFLLKILHTHNFFAPVAMAVTLTTSPTKMTMQVTATTNFETGTVNDARGYLNA